MPERHTPQQRRVEFDRLNWIGKAVFLGGAGIQVASTLLDQAIDRAADLVVATERAFKQGRDEQIEDAQILDEYEER